MKLFFINSLLSLCLLIPLMAEDDLVFGSNPPGAGVFLGGVKLGTTPFTLDKDREDIPLFDNPGKAYNFIIYKEFFEGEIITVTYKRGKKEKIEVDLQYLKRLPLYDGKFQAGYRLDFYALLMNSDPRELEYLNAEIYAKYGKRISIDGENPFHDYTWYRLNPFYTEDFLNETDLANLELIETFANPPEEDINGKELILLNSEYYSDQTEELSLIFTDESSVNLIRGSDFDNPYEPGNEEYLYWNVVNNSVYLWNDESGEIYEVALNHEQQSIEYFQPIHLEYEEM